MNLGLGGRIESTRLWGGVAFGPGIDSPYGAFKIRQGLGPWTLALQGQWHPESERPEGYPLSQHGVSLGLEYRLGGR